MLAHTRASSLYVCLFFGFAPTTILVAQVGTAPANSTVATTTSNVTNTAGTLTSPPTTTPTTTTTTTTTTPTTTTTTPTTTPTTSTPTAEVIEWDTSNTQTLDQQPGAI